ncbi:MAG: hypothetical protein JW783_10335 [Bacteroidales bacterium]|nr:hypothetical protein [Bacteroidales bacterium]MBN2748952.1 hypothetical protein [Bacteroidales bacterium]
MRTTGILKHLQLLGMGMALCLYGYSIDPFTSDSTATPPTSWDRAAYYTNLNLLANPSILAPSSLPPATLLQTGYTSNTGNQWLTPYQGTYQEQYHANVTSYNRKGSNAAFGKASFKRRNNHATKWQLNQHIDRIAPYTITDTIGGNQQTEDYLFEGGVTRRVGQFLLGISAGYQSAIMWKTLNPRPKNTAAETYANAGISFKVKEHTIALGLSYSRYTQYLSVTSRSNNNRADMIYAQKGFGITHNSISGMKSDYSRTYKGHLYGASATILTDDIMSSYLKVSAYHETINTVESNETIPFVLSKWQVGINAGLAAHATKSTYRIESTGNLFTSNGTEQFYEHVKIDPTTQLYNWVLLTKGVLYTNREREVGIKASWLREASSTRWYVLTIGSTYTNSNQAYNKTSNSIKSQNVLLFTNAHISIKRGKYTFATTANINQNMVLSSTVNLPNATWPRKQDLEMHYKYMLSNSTQWGAKVSLLKALPKAQHIGVSVGHSRLHAGSITTYATSLTLEVLL